MTPAKMRARIVQRLAAYWLLALTGGIAVYWIYQHGFAGLLAAGVLIAIGLLAI